MFSGKQFQVTEKTKKKKKRIEIGFTALSEINPHSKIQEKEKKRKKMS